VTPTIEWMNALLTRAGVDPQTGERKGALPVYDGDRCRCGHLGADHGPHSPFDDCCFVDGCGCESFEFPDYSTAGGGL
jgi:hypothetical protein